MKVKVIKSFPTSDWWINEWERNVAYWEEERQLWFRENWDADRLFVIDEDVVRQFKDEHFSLEWEVVMEYKIDFTWYVWKFWKELCIFWEGWTLESETVSYDKGIYNNIDIIYTKVNVKDSYTETPDYEECRLSQLEYGDIFIRKEIADKWNFDVSNFCIFLKSISKSISTWCSFWVYYLDKFDSQEFIHNFLDLDNTKVYKFKRE